MDGAAEVTHIGGGRGHMSLPLPVAAVACAWVRVQAVRTDRLGQPGLIHVRAAVLLLELQEAE